MSLDLQFKPLLSVSELEDGCDFEFFDAQEGKGLRFVPETHRSHGMPSLDADSGDFAKWLRQKHPSLRISLPVDTPKMVRRSADIWLPLIYLGSDVSVQVFLSMAANYLYDKAKGALRNDRPRIHIRAIYQDKMTGKTKKLELSGDADALAKAIKRFDLNNFFDDAP